MQGDGGKRVECKLVLQRENFDIGRDLTGRSLRQALKLLDSCCMDLHRGGAVPEDFSPRIE